MVRIHPSSRFKRSFKKMPRSIKESFDNKIKLFIKHPFHPKLETHKLHGKLAPYYAFYLRDGYRVLFDFLNDNNVLLINVGSHNDYKKWARS